MGAKTERHNSVPLILLHLPRHKPSMTRLGTNTWVGKGQTYEREERGCGTAIFKSSRKWDKVDMDKSILRRRRTLEKSVRSRL